MTIVAFLELGDGEAHLLDIPEDAAVDRLFLQRPVEAFGHPVGLGFGDEGEAGRDAPDLMEQMEQMEWNKWGQTRLFRHIATSRARLPRSPTRTASSSPGSDTTPGASRLSLSAATPASTRPGKAIPRMRCSTAG